MGVFRLYAEIAQHLTQDPAQLSHQSLEGIAAVYSPYAYIDDRRHLQTTVLRDAQHLRSCPNVKGQSPDEIAIWWFGRSDWQVKSDIFPDFVLAYENSGTVGDGALLELKDSKEAGIASFNSMLPSARKSVSQLTALVRDSIRRYESCLYQGPDERDCFYLVRTYKSKPEATRLSLVHGTFFETLPTAVLLEQLWKQLLEQARVPASLQQQVLSYLAQMERANVAQTRQIEGASIKPRLRVMSEIHREGNPHTYPEIPARSVNLILKLPTELETITEVDEREMRATQWLQDQFMQDKVSCQASTYLTVNSSIQTQVRFIQHRRNGLHLVVQLVV